MTESTPQRRTRGVVRLEYMAEFIALAETPNFTVVAERLFLAQPTLTKHIQTLESELGCQLLDRTTHSVVLTDDGRRSLESFKRILDEYEDLREEMEQRRLGLAGTLRIGALYYGLQEMLLPIVEEVERRYPNLRLDVRSCQPHQIIAGLNDGSFDAGMIFRTPALPDDRFRFLHLRSDDPMFVRARRAGSPAPAEQPLSVLEDETLVIVSIDPALTDLDMAFLAANEVVPKAIVDAGQIDLVVSKLRSTNGVFLGTPVLEHMAPGQLEYTRILAPVPQPLSMGIVSPIDLQSAALRTFLGIAAEVATTLAT